MPVMNGPVGCEELLGRELPPPLLLLPGCEVVPPLADDAGPPLLVELPGGEEVEPNDAANDDDGVTSPLLEVLASPASMALGTVVQRPSGQVSPAWQSAAVWQVRTHTLLTQSNPDEQSAGSWHAYACGDAQPDPPTRLRQAKAVTTHVQRTAGA